MQKSYIAGLVFRFKGENGDWTVTVLYEGNPFADCQLATVLIARNYLIKHGGQSMAKVEQRTLNARYRNKELFAISSNRRNSIRS